MKVWNGMGTVVAEISRDCGWEDTEGKVCLFDLNSDSGI